jgi:hypothetical protein
MPPFQPAAQPTGLRNKRPSEASLTAPQGSKPQFAIK